MKIVSILQPVYLPWLGYFEQMAVADHFVFMDDVQYTRKDWRNRNRVKTANGPVWLTVPVQRHPRSAKIRDVRINYQQAWRRGHLKSLELNYRKCPGFQPLFGEIEAELAKGGESLLDLDCRLIHLLCRHLQIETPTSFSSEIPKSVAEGDRNGRILEICESLGADVLYDGFKAAEFIDLDRFERAGVTVVFQDYAHPVYPQRFGGFASHMSAVDLIMNTDSEAAAILDSTVPAVLGSIRRR